MQTQFMNNTAQQLAEEEGITFENAYFKVKETVPEKEGRKAKNNDHFNSIFLMFYKKE